MRVLRIRRRDRMSLLLRRGNGRGRLLAGDAAGQQRRHEIVGDGVVHLAAAVAPRDSGDDSVVLLGGDRGRDNLAARRLRAKLSTGVKLILRSKVLCALF